MPVSTHKSRVPHISLVFREMWDTTAVSVKPSSSATTFHESVVLPSVILSEAGLSRCAVGPERLTDWSSDTGSSTPRHKRCAARSICEGALLRMTIL
jgi:hypothetical protein